MTTKTKKSRIQVIEERCKGCAFCVEFCPKHILYQTNETNAKGYQLVRISEPGKCTECGMCSRVCPEFAIYLETPDDKQ